MINKENEVRFVFVSTCSSRRSRQGSPDGASSKLQSQKCSPIDTWLSLESGRNVVGKSKMVSSNLTLWSWRCYWQVVWSLPVWVSVGSSRASQQILLSLSTSEAARTFISRSSNLTHRLKTAASVSFYSYAFFILIHRPPYKRLVCFENLSS